MPVVTTLHRIVYQNGKKSVSVAPSTTLELSDDLAAYFTKSNAVRAATEGEQAVYEKSQAPSKAAAKKAADKAAADADAKQADADAKKAADEKAAADAAAKQAADDPLA